MKRGSSLRFIECPMPLTSGLVLGGCMALLLTQLYGRVLNGFDDVHVAGASAQVSGNGLADLGLARARVARQKRHAGHHHARGAVAALQAVLLPEALLDGMQLAALLQPLDRFQLAPVGLD